MVYTECIKQFRTPEDDYSPGVVATDRDGNVYISGSTRGVLDGTSSAGNLDVWLAKYDTEGNLLWTKQLGSSETNASQGIVTDSNDNVYISGNTSGSLDGASSVGSNDAWLAKIVQSNTRKIDDLENLQPLTEELEGLVGGCVGNLFNDLDLFDDLDTEGIILDINPNLNNIFIV